MSTEKEIENTTEKVVENQEETTTDSVKVEEVDQKENVNEEEKEVEKDESVVDPPKETESEEQPNEQNKQLVDEKVEEPKEDNKQDNEKTDDQLEDVDLNNEKVEEQPENVDLNNEKVEEQPENVDLNNEKTEEQPENVDLNNENAEEQLENVELNDENVDKKEELIENEVTKEEPNNEEKKEEIKETTIEKEPTQNDDVAKEEIINKEVVQEEEIHNETIETNEKEVTPEASEDKLNEKKVTFSKGIIENIILPPEEENNDNISEDSNDGEEDLQNISKEELIEKVKHYKEKSTKIKVHYERQLKNTNDYIVRLEEATEQRLDRLKKQNSEEIDEMKKISDQVIKKEKEKMTTYVNNMKKGVDDEREVLRQIEIDSKARYQKEKEAKVEAYDEINRLNSVISNLKHTLEDDQQKIHDLEKKNMELFSQKDEELAHMITTVEQERQKNKEAELAIQELNEKLEELKDELHEYKEESKIRKSQINLLSEENHQMDKKVQSLTRKNEELVNLNELKTDEANGLKHHIERLNQKLDHLKRKRVSNRMNMGNGISPLTPFSGNSSFCITSSPAVDDRKYSEYSNTSSANESMTGKNSLGITPILPATITNENEESEKTDRKDSNITNEPLSEISLNNNQESREINTISEEGEKEEVVNVLSEEKTTTVALSSLSSVSSVDGGDMINTKTTEGKSNSRPNSLSINTGMTINVNGGDAAFDYQDEFIDEENDVDSDDNLNQNELNNMSMIQKPLIFHSNDQTYLNFKETIISDYTKIYTTKLVKSCELEEVTQCLDFSGSYIGFFSRRKLLNGLKNNTVVIEKVPDLNKKVSEMVAKGNSAASLETLECSLCSIKNCENKGQVSWYQFNFDDEKIDVSELICMFCRERLVSVCNWYKYIKMVHHKIIKQDIDTIYVNCLHLKESMYHARNGLISDEDNSSSIVNVITNPVESNMAIDNNINMSMNMSMGLFNINGSNGNEILQPNLSYHNEFVDVNINEDGNVSILKGLNKDEMLNEDSSNASFTLQNNSDTEYTGNNDNAQTPKATTTKRPSFIFNNPIAKKLSMTSTN